MIPQFAKIVQDHSRESPRARQPQDHRLGWRRGSASRIF
jgi:hypothetical protein